MEIKREIEADPELVARLRRKFSIKNTTGYHMEAFLDGDTPLGIFRRLIVGSEGTLAFIVEAVFETIRDDQYRLTAFMIFPDMRSACAAVKPFVDQGAAAVELTDRASLRAVEGKPGVPDRWHALPETATGLLVEFREPHADARVAAEARAAATLAGLELLEPAEFTQDAAVAAQFWNVRSGLLASVGGARAVRDVVHPRGRLLSAGAARRRRARPAGAVPPSRLRRRDLRSRVGGQPALPDHAVAERAEGSGALRRVHAGRGPARRRQVRRLAEGRARDGPEHRAVRRARVGRQADRADVAAEAPRRSAGILSPGVMLSDDPQSHLANLHTAPTVEPASTAASSAATASGFARAGT